MVKVRVTTPVPERLVTIEMSESMAETLRIVCAKIGGDPKLSRRADTNAIGMALLEAGINRPSYPESVPVSSIFFPDEER